MTLRHELEDVLLTDPNERWWELDEGGTVQTSEVFWTSIDPPLSHGTVPVGKPRIGAATYALKVRVTGSTMAELEENEAELKRAITFPKLILTLKRHPDGVQSLASKLTYCQRKGVIKADRVQTGSGRFIDYSLTFEIPSGRWFDTYDSADSFTGTGAMKLEMLSGGSAPMSPQIKFPVEFANQYVKITDVDSGTWVSFRGSPAIGSTVTVIPAYFLATNTAGTNLSGMIDMSGYPFELSPSGRILVEKNGSSQVTVIGKRAYQ